MDFWSLSEKNVDLKVSRETLWCLNNEFYITEDKIKQFEALDYSSAFVVDLLLKVLL